MRRRAGSRDCSRASARSPRPPSCFGLLELADYLGSGVIILACVGVGVDALRGVAERLVALARGRMAAGGLPRLEQGTQRLLDVAAIGLWLFVGLDRYELREPAFALAGRVLGARLELGGLSLSLGGALGFVAAVLAGWLLSRVVVFVLEAAVFPRASLPRGVPYALTQPGSLQRPARGLPDRARDARPRPDAPHAAGERARPRARLRPPADRAELRVGPDPAVRAPGADRRRRPARRAHGRGGAHRHPLEHAAHLRRRGGDRAELEPGRAARHELDALGPAPPHRPRADGRRGSGSRPACSRCCSRWRRAIPASGARPRPKRCCCASARPTSSSSCACGPTSRTGCACKSDLAVALHAALRTPT